MHNTKKNKFKFIFTISILITVVLIVPAYAYMIQQLGIEGKIAIEKPKENEVCDGNITYKIESWSNNNLNYYKLSFTINNDSPNDYNFWDVYFDVPHDAELSTYSSTEAEIIGNKIKASNAVYNGTILSGESTVFEIQMTTLQTEYEPTVVTLNNCTTNNNSNNENGSGEQPEQPEQPGQPEQPEQLGQMNVEFKVVASYGNYTYQYDVIVKNNSDDRIQGWNFRIVKPENTKLTNAWNANYIIKEEEIEFSDAGYNNVIEPGQTVMFGIIVETDIYGYMPEVINE